MESVWDPESLVSIILVPSLPLIFPGRFTIKWWEWGGVWEVLSVTAQHKLSLVVLESGSGKSKRRNDN